MMKTPRLSELLSLAACRTPDETNVTYAYEALTPSVLDKEEAKYYIEALNFAFHRNDIRNIAVTGPYGAGKSSILLTWSKIRKEDLKIMTVSLADFEMVRAVDGADAIKDEKNIASERKARLEEKSIEYSILQQLLYKARKSELPYSRIERIADVTPSQVRYMARDLMATLVSSVAGLVFLFPNYFRKAFSLSTRFSEFLLALPAVIRLGLAGGALLISFCMILSKLHRIGIFDRRVSIDKIDLLKGATVSTRPSDPSLLNVYIDEIVYFFEKKKYNAVIFEDLDRHNDGAIFIKLREINQIINNCLPAENPVRFIYAVRDDLFRTPEARTKFFDFVMPVIPVMDSENAVEHFMEKFSKDELEIKGFSECISRLSLFIPDMRVMRNITNEFQLYRNVVGDGDSLIRLLSLIAYKNICSEDYHLIDKKEGVLYSFITAYTSGELRNNVEAERTNSINHLKDKLNKIKEETAKDENSIRADILSPYVTFHQKGKLAFKFRNNGTIITLGDAITNESVFTNLLTSGPVSVQHKNYANDIIILNVNDLQVMQENYAERKQSLRLKSEDHIHILENEIDNLKKGLRQVQGQGLKYFVEKLGHKGFSDWVKEKGYQAVQFKESHKNDAEQLDFIYFLLLHGYVASDYMSYRSVFKPGSLSTVDRAFVRAVSTGRRPEETLCMPLERVGNVIDKLASLGLLMENRAWHPDILLYLLQHEKRQLKSIMQLEADGDQEQSLTLLTEQIFKHWVVGDSIQYVHLMTSDPEKCDRFLRRLQKMSDKDAALQLFILLMCAAELQWNSDTTEMRHRAAAILLQHSDFPEHVPDGFAQQFVDNLKKSRISISQLSKCTASQGREVVRKIVDLKLWNYSGDILTNIILTLSDQDLNIRDKLFKTPFASVDALGIPSLSETIQENINHFVNHFFITSQEHDRVIDVLNNAKVDMEIIFSINFKMEFIIENLQNVKNRSGVILNYEKIPLESSLYSLLLRHNHVTPKWAEVYYLLNESIDIDPWFAMWFENNHHNFEDILISADSYELFEQIMQRLFCSGTLSESARHKILISAQICFMELPLNTPFECAALLINQNRLAPSAHVFQQLYEKFQEEGDGLTALLANIVTQHPALLEAETEFVLINDDEFDRPLATLLLTDGKISPQVCMHALNWLWNYDSELFAGSLFFAPAMLPQLAPGLVDDDMRRALLVQSLKAGDIPHTAISQVLSSLTDPDYHIFLSNKVHRSVVYTQPFSHIADLLASAGFIQSLKVNEARKRIRFVPHNSPAFRRG